MTSSQAKVIGTPCPDCAAEWHADANGGSCNHAQSCPLVVAKVKVRMLDAFWFRHIGLPQGVGIRIRELAPCERTIYNWRGIQVPDEALLAVIWNPADEFPGDEFFTFPPGYAPE